MTNLNNLFLEIEKKKNQPVRDAVLEHGPDVRDNNKRTPLINAAFYNNLELLDWLIESGADVNAQDRLGYSALHFCVQENHPQCVAKLLASGADPNLQDEHGNSAAAVAITNWKGGDNFANLKALIDAGIDLTRPNHAGRSVADILPPPIKQQLGL